ncbi:MAG: EAL domain-containing protein, partial [Oscillospiraceae bacterium]|nr:EAL domain-containing protein [Oscillospiraceae bacterium]
DYYVNPQKLTIEIDATALDLYDAKLAETLKGYKELGFKLAIDNYGVDNASLLKLQEMEFDTIKIGNGFIDKICENRKTYEIVKNIIKMARDLNIGIVAKGVDTTQQKEYLLDLKCLYMQGRVFGEPGYLSI